MTTHNLIDSGGSGLHGLQYFWMDETFQSFKIKVSFTWEPQFNVNPIWNHFDLAHFTSLDSWFLSTDRLESVETTSVEVSGICWKFGLENLTWKEVRDKGREVSQYESKKKLVASIIKCQVGNCLACPSNAVSGWAGWGLVQTEQWTEAKTS